MKSGKLSFVINMCQTWKVCYKLSFYNMYAVIKSDSLAFQLHISQKAAIHELTFRSSIDMVIGYQSMTLRKGIILQKEIVTNPYLNLVLSVTRYNYPFSSDIWKLALFDCIPSVNLSAWLLMISTHWVPNSTSLDVWSSNECMIQASMDHLPLYSMVNVLTRSEIWLKGIKVWLFWLFTNQIIVYKMSQAHIKTLINLLFSFNVLHINLHLLCVSTRNISSVKITHIIPSYDNLLTN